MGGLLAEGSHYPGIMRFGRGQKKKEKKTPRREEPLGEKTLSFLYYRNEMGNTEQVRVKVRPGEMEEWLKNRLLFLRDTATGKREQDLHTFQDLADAYNTLEGSGKHLWVEHPNDRLSERVGNMEKCVANQANAFEAKSTRAIVKDPEFHAELKTSKLTLVNDGHSVKFGMVTKRGNFMQVMELDGLAMNRDDALLVVNEAKLSPSDKDIDYTEKKKRELEHWLRDAAAQKTKFATQPAEVQGELFGEGEEGITWKIHLVLSGDNFSAKMEKECDDAEIFVVRSNGAGYGFSRPSSASASSEATELAPSPVATPSASPAASPSSPPALPTLGEQSTV